jgi:hypothetical protein
MEDLTKLSRKQLQAEAKQHGVKANLASDEIIRQLQALRSETQFGEHTPAVATNEGAGHRGSVEGSAVQQTQDQESSVAREAEEAQEAPPAANAAGSEAVLQANTMLVERLGRLSERLDLARLSFLSAPADEQPGAEENPADSSGEARRDSLEEELERQFSPPKTTMLLPATPRCKTPRASLGRASRAPPTSTSPKTEDPVAAAPEASLGLAAGPGGVVMAGIYGAPQAATSVTRPWTPSSTPLVSAPSSQTDSHNAVAPEASSSGASILQTEEYWRMRAERSEKKRRRFEEDTGAGGHVAAPESTQSFCKRIAGMCQEVSRLTTPHKNLGLSSATKMRHHELPTISSYQLPTISSSFKARPPPLASFCDASEATGHGTPTCLAPTPTCLAPTTPSGLTKSAKVCRVKEGGREGGRVRWREAV